MNRSTTAACALALTTFAVTGSACGLTQSNDPAKGSKGTGTINVESSGGACDLTAKKAPSGNVVFKVKNTGNEVTEFYLYGSDGLRIVGEIENIGPGLTRDLVVRAQPGKYVTACKPGMKGQGIRSAFQVTDSGKDTAIKGVDQADIDTATSQYAAYVKDQSPGARRRHHGVRDGLQVRRRRQGSRAVPASRAVTTSGSSPSRSPSATSTRARPARGRPREGPGVDRLAPDREGPVAAGQGLRARSTPPERKKYGDNLLANTQDLQKRVQTLKFTVDQIGNGSKGLLDEVAASKITGEEDTWSHTDLWDFQANVDGARVGFEGLKPILEVKNPALSQQIQAPSTSCSRCSTSTRRATATSSTTRSPRRSASSSPTR